MANMDKMAIMTVMAWLHMAMNWLILVYMRRTGKMYISSESGTEKFEVRNEELML